MDHTHSKGTLVFVVEDHDDYREVIAALVATWGHRVATAKGGKQALDLLRSEGEPALLLLDLLMPGVSGFDVLEALRADPTLPKTSVIIVSVLSRAEAGVRGYPYLQKPFLPEQLSALLRTHSPAEE